MVAKTKKGKDRLDKYYQLAKDQGYRARSAFKLIQLAKKYDFLSKSTVCLDLCAAPGSWMQVAQKNMPRNSTIIGIDLAPIKAIPGCVTMQCDITTEKCRSLLKKELLGKRADCVLHDGAPNVGTSWVKDAYAQNELTLHSMKLACEHLRVGGHFITKVFRSQDYNSLMWTFSQLFNKVEATKPQSSRNVSAEIFVMCLGFKGGKIDPKFYDPKYVFMEALEPVQNLAKGGKAKSTGALLNEAVKRDSKKHRGGYEEGDLLRILPAQEFFASTSPASLMVNNHRISLTATGSEIYDKHPTTTMDIRELCADLRVLGKGDLTILLKWRMKIVRETEKSERALRKAADKLALDAKKAAARQKSADAAGAVDDVLDDLLDEDARKARADAVKEDSDAENIAAEEKLEEELAEQIQIKRREERRNDKKLMERQKKQELRKKMSLGMTNDPADAVELFKISDRNVEALEDQDHFLEPTDIHSEESASEEPYVPESESEGELDRTAKMEVDMAVYYHLRHLREHEKNPNAMRKRKKAKKETRRKKVMAAWAGELTEFNQAIQNQAAEDLRLRNKESDDEQEALDDDSDSEEDLAELRSLQEGLAKKSDKYDDVAMGALLDGPEKEELSESSSDDEVPAVGGSTATSTALVPVEDDDENIRSDHRVARWFDQDIFQAVVPKKKNQKMIPLDRDSDEEDSDDDDGKMKEWKDSELPKMPLTDQEKRKLKRKKDEERSKKRGKRGDDEEVNEADKGPVEVAPMELPKPIVPRNLEGDSLRPEDPNELAETMAIGSLLVDSKKSRMELIDAGYNRWTFDKQELLPDWFADEEEKYNRSELPITKEMVAAFKAKLKEINARPIRKVAQARARKNRRLTKRLEKLRSTAMSLVNATDMSEGAKAKMLRAEVRKLDKQEERKVTVVAIKKGGGGKTKGGKIPKGSKVKVVDKRMKSDLRGQRKAAARNKGKDKHKKVKQMKKTQARRARGRK